MNKLSFVVRPGRKDVVLVWEGLSDKGGREGQDELKCADVACEGWTGRS